MLCCQHKFIFFPTLLIIIGFLALLTNLGVISTSIWQWWPLLIVIFGIYLLVWQKRKMRLMKGLIFYGAINKLMKSEKVQSLLENEKVHKELNKIGDVVESVITEQIDKLHKKYAKKK